LAIHAYKNHYGGSGEISFWNSKDDRIDSLMTELDFETFQLIKNIVTSKNILSNKELGENYWLESFNKNNMEKDASPMNELVQRIPTRVVETNLNERRYIEYEDAIEEISSYEMTPEQ
jgi:hypothetical protein